MKISFPCLKEKNRFVILVLLCFIASFEDAVAQTLGWNFGVSAGSLVPSSGTPISNLTVSNFSQGNVLGSIVANTNSPSPSTGYTGASGNYYFGHSARTGALNTSLSAYYQFTLTPAAGYSVIVTSIKFGIRSTSNGPTTYSLRANSNNYTSSLASGSSSASWVSRQNTGLNIISSTGTPITFRLFGYGGTGSFTGGAINWQIDDVQITVSVVGTPDYRTKANGNFSAASTWQYKSGSTWLDAATAPTNQNSITISHSVVLDQDFSVSKNLTVATGGSLVIDATKTLDVLTGGTAAFGGNPVTIKSGPSGTGSIGKIAGTLSGANNVTVERYIPAGSSRAWRLLAVPTTGSQTIYQAWQENGSPLTSNGFGTQLTKPGGNAATNGYDAASGSASLLNTYDVATNKWSNTITDTKTTPIATGGGYFVFIRGDRSKGITGSTTDVNATTLRTTGTLKQGIITSASIGADEYAVLGNPYPSAISFDLLTLSGVDNTFYIWDANKLQGTSLGFYQTFAFANSYAPTPGGGSYSGANKTIESGQAFFVHSSGSNGNVTFTESAKVASTSHLGLRPASPSDINSLVKMSTKLFGASAEILDGNDVVFNNKYENTVNGDDALKMKNSAENFGIIRDNKQLAVEARKAIADNDELVFSMSNLKQQTYKLQITPQHLDIEGLTATLEDNYKKTSTILSLKEKNEFEFTVDADVASSSADRFKVVFKLAKIVTPPVEVVAKPGISVSPNPVQGSLMNVQFAGKAAGVYKLRILNNTGQVLMNKTIQHAGGSVYNHSITLPAGIAGGNYQIEVTAPDKSRSTQKILINK